MVTGLGYCTIPKETCRGSRLRESCDGRLHQSCDRHFGRQNVCCSHTTGSYRCTARTYLCLSSRKGWSRCDPVYREEGMRKSEAHRLTAGAARLRQVPTSALSFAGGWHSRGRPDARTRHPLRCVVESRRQRRPLLSHRTVSVTGFLVSPKSERMRKHDSPDLRRDRGIGSRTRQALPTIAPMAKVAEQPSK